MSSRHCFILSGTTPGFLENSVTMSMDAEQFTDRVDIEMSITNDQVGHHVPTGAGIKTPG